MNIRIYSHQKNDANMIRTNIRTRKYSNIFEYPNIRHTLVWPVVLVKPNVNVDNAQCFYPFKANIETTAFQGPDSRQLCKFCI